MSKQKQTYQTPKRKKSFDKYQNYPAEVVLKIVLKYAWKSRVLIVVSLTFLLAFTYLELLQPKLINTILDDHLLGVQTTWVKVEDGDVEYLGNEYRKVKKDEEVANQEIISIVYCSNSYYLLYGLYSSSDVVEFDEEKQMILLVDDSYVEAHQLNKSELKAFYEPSVNPIIKLLISEFIYILK